MIDDTGAEVRPGGNDPAAGLDWLLAQQAIAGLRAIAAQGPIHVTGPFAGNRDFIAALQQGWPFPVRPRSYEASLVDQVASLFDEGQG